MKKGILLFAAFFILSCRSSELRSTERMPSGAIKKVLIPIPDKDFDPSEAAIPWSLMKAAGIEIYFATEDGRVGSADPAEITGDGLGPLAKFIAADANGRHAYAELTLSEEFKNPLAWSQLKERDYDAIYLPGGHSPGMQPYLRSAVLQKLIVDFFAADKPVGAICHGALLVARSISPTTGKSVLYGRKTTSLTQFLEMMGYEVAKDTGGADYAHFRTDSETVETQVKSYLAMPSDYLEGPKSLFRDSPKDLGRGFVIQDRNYMSARWPGDAFHFGTEFAKLVNSYQPQVSPQVRIYYVPYRKQSMYVRVGEYLPRQAPRGDVLYLTGFADRLDNHGPLFQQWLNQGLRVVSFDFPSHGEDYGWGDNLNAFTIGNLEELSRNIEAVTKPTDSRPLIVAGWSTGGLIAARLIDPTQKLSFTRPVAGAILFAPGVAVRGVVGDDGIVTLSTLTSNPNPPHQGPLTPKSPWFYPGFALSILYDQELSQRVTKDMPRHIPILTFVSGADEDHYVHAEKVKAWVLASRDAGVQMSGVLCDHSHHELDNEPGNVGADVRNVAGLYAAAVVAKDPNLSGVANRAQACHAF